MEAIKTEPFCSLEKDSRALKKQHITNLFNQDASRAERFSVKSKGLFLDYSKNLIHDQSLTSLLAFAEVCHLPAAIERLFSGEISNISEGRAALHTHLRLPNQAIANTVSKDVLQTKHKMADACEKVLEGTWTGATGKAIRDVIAIGVGGSHLGPQCAITALKPFWQQSIRVQYLANIDARELQDRLIDCEPESTLVIVASKSFQTHETLLNAQSVKDWLIEALGQDKDLSPHFIALTANVSAAEAFGIPSQQVLPLWDWVGGRFSLWSSIGLPIALQIGWENFERLLSGAHEMDKHFREEPLSDNMPVLMALLQYWYQTFFGATSQAVLPYAYDLRDLPAHLQQLSMESLGKSVDTTGHSLATATGAVVWGGVGVNGQHAYHQLLHQGTHLVPVDFILPAISQSDDAECQSWLVANCLSQSRTLMTGQSYEAAHEQLIASGIKEAQAREQAKHLVMQGNRPSNTLILDSLNPENLGALLALYEHKVYVESILYGVNCFDQWGVELGKTTATALHRHLNNKDLEQTDLDASTQQLITHCQDRSL